MEDHESRHSSRQSSAAATGRGRSRAFRRRRALIMAACAVLLAAALPVGIHTAAQARPSSPGVGSTAKNPVPGQASVPAAAPAVTSTPAPTSPPRPVGTDAGSTVDAGLDAKINGIIAANPEYQIGVALMDLSGGSTSQEIHQYGVESPFEAASTAKVLAAEAFYHLVETGAASLDDVLGAYPADFQLQAMLQQSDNDSWSLIMDAVGHEELTDYANSLGVAYTPESNTLTTADMARILAGLYSGALLNAVDTEQLLSTMQNTNDETLIPAAVPAGVSVYHKYGELAGELHDAAILDKGGHAFVLVVYTKGDDLGSVPERTGIIHEVTESVANELFPGS